jgi:hypothetical protein
MDGQARSVAGQLLTHPRTPDIGVGGRVRAFDGEILPAPKRPIWPQALMDQRGKQLFPQLLVTTRCGSHFHLQIARVRIHAQRTHRLHKRMDSR